MPIIGGLSQQLKSYWQTADGGKLVRLYRGDCAEVPSTANLTGKTATAVRVGKSVNK